MIRLQPGFIVASLFSCALASPFVSAASFAFDVTACGQTIEAGETGVLQADLDCPVNNDPDLSDTGLFMEPRAVFDLNGHTLNTAGTFHFVCTPHQDLGMTGTLTVR